jgi:5-methylcytosine-specific restriction endonuclease McrA
MLGEIIGRKYAIENNLSRYFTGKPCKRGHVDIRMTANGNCVKCVREREQCAYHADIEKSRAYQNASRAKNREKWRKRYRVWREANPEKAREYSRRYAREHPENRTAIKLRRRARKVNAEGCHTADDIKRLLELQKRKCASCGIPIAGGYHVDHIVALSKGGSNDPYNLQILCPTCNWSKGAKDPIRFAQENQRLL